MNCNKSIPLVIISTLFSFNSYAQKKAGPEVKNQKEKTEQKEPVKEGDYNPERTILCSPKTIVIMDNKLMSFDDANDYCYVQKKGYFKHFCSLKEGIFYYGEKGRNIVIEAKSIK